MAVNIETKTERTIMFDLGELVLCEETGYVRFESVRSTNSSAMIREFVNVLNDVAVMMESCGK
jgi:hypothetical protein